MIPKNPIIRNQFARWALIFLLKNDRQKKKKFTLIIFGLGSEVRNHLCTFAQDHLEIETTRKAETSPTIPPPQVLWSVLTRPASPVLLYLCKVVFKENNSLVKKIKKMTSLVQVLILNIKLSSVLNIKILGLEWL